jgi:hypothetical protein
MATPPITIVSRVADTKGSTIESPAAAKSSAAAAHRRAGEAGTDTEKFATTDFKGWL